MTIVHILLAALGIGFLIFIHEFGHYVCARRQGMTVETFSIGFGPPLLTWKHKGVKWQLCVLPFGGYVKIAGMERKGSLEPHQVEGGFYSKSTWARIKVALAGPFVNIAFAFLMFCAIWAFGGRERSFSQHTKTLGWVAPQSGFYAEGMRPGDVIDEINGKPYRSFEQFFTETLLSKEPWTVRGTHVDYLTQAKESFVRTPSFLAPLSQAERLKLVMQSLGPAQFLLFAPPQGSETPPEAPIATSGLRPGDRLIWANGHVLFSSPELHSALNAQEALLTVQRDEKRHLILVPKCKIADLKLTREQKGELDDIKYAARVKIPFHDVVYIPYIPDSKGVVQESTRIIDGDPAHEGALHEGDRILAVNGMPVHSAQELMRELQTPRAVIIVQSHERATAPSWSKAEALFSSDIDWHALESIVGGIGTAHPLTEKSGLRLLSPIPLMPLKEMSWLKGVTEQQGDTLGLGIHLQDLGVAYNPSPFTLCGHAMKEMWRTLAAIFSGNLSPKWLAGPLGIVQVMEHSWAEGAKEGLFWLGLISLNLGIFNLLPLPVLDGGHVGFALWESITRRRIKAKTLERLIIPFVVLFVAFFIYLTYHDILKLFK